MPLPPVFPPPTVWTGVSSRPEMASQGKFSWTSTLVDPLAWPSHGRLEVQPGAHVLDRSCKTNKYPSRRWQPYSSEELAILGSRFHLSRPLPPPAPLFGAFNQMPSPTRSRHPSSLARTPTLVVGTHTNWVPRLGRSRDAGSDYAAVSFQAALSMGHLLGRPGRLFCLHASQPSSKTRGNDEPLEARTGQRLR